MIIKTKEFKECCSKILGTVGSSELSTLTETLELIVQENILYLNVTNKEYYVSAKFALEQAETFHATVNASLFLKLASQTTVEDMSLEVAGNSLIIKANGTYKIPLIYEGDHLMELPKIILHNPTVEMSISGDILNSILNYNGRELTSGLISRPSQRMYYVDQQGCITFTSTPDACINSFTLEKPVTLMIPNRVVKLFKLFKSDLVQFKLSHEAVAEGIVQPCISMETPTIKLGAILNGDESLLKSVPMAEIRDRANKPYPYSVVLSRIALLQAINRLTLFSGGYGAKQTSIPYSTFNFKREEVEIWSTDQENVEKLNYLSDSSLNADYSVVLNLNGLASVLGSCDESDITLNFGNHEAVVLVRGSVRNVLPEIVAKDINA